ncbi:MAG TPA: 16S rRNA (guanine(527)-N(7))-methyltransferase RsmG [Burkholderiaceae bacterium]|nr:16S rRNA (guanine(527)-N(7))-methyltransferase RsmG [Burkholderiaceae bacterium]
MAGQGKYAERLHDAALSLNVHLDERSTRVLLSYIDQLQRWNKTYNLTALRDPEQMLVQHVFDSIAALSPLAEQLYKNTVSDAQVVDVGSGAGLPGIVLAALKPAWQVCCIDAVEKKTAFVRQMSGVLALPNLKAVHARVETLAPLGADIVVSRAFASLADFATLAGAHVDAKGHLVAMKGREPTDEIETLQQQTPWRVDRIQSLVVPELSAQRCLVWMSRQGNP